MISGGGEFAAGAAPAIIGRWLGVALMPSCRAFISISSAQAFHNAYSVFARSFAIVAVSAGNSSYNVPKPSAALIPFFALAFSCGIIAAES